MLILIGLVDERTNVQDAVRIPLRGKGWQELNEWIRDLKARAMLEDKTVILVTEKDVRYQAPNGDGLPTVEILRRADYAVNLVKARGDLSISIEGPRLPIIFPVVDSETS